MPAKCCSASSLRSSCAAQHAPSTISSIDIWMLVLVRVARSEAYMHADHRGSARTLQKPPSRQRTCIGRRRIDILRRSILARTLVLLCDAGRLGVSCPIQMFLQFLLTPFSGSTSQYSSFCLCKFTALDVFELASYLSRSF